MYNVYIYHTYLVESGWGEARLFCHFRLLGWHGRIEDPEIRKKSNLAREENKLFEGNKKNMGLER